MGGITPVVKSKPHSFHKLWTRASFPGNADHSSTLGALGASLGDGRAVTCCRCAHAGEQK